jgi:hypothetical protein
MLEKQLLGGFEGTLTMHTCGIILILIYTMSTALEEGIRLSEQNSLMPSIVPQADVKLK